MITGGGSDDATGELIDKNEAVVGIEGSADLKEALDLNEEDRHVGTGTLARLDCVSNELLELFAVALQRG